MENSEAALIEQARRGSPEAFRVLVETHSRAVFRLAYRMTGNEHDAEDMVQETFLRAYRQIERFDSRAKFSTWLFTIAGNCSRDLLRARRRRSEVSPDPEQTHPLENVPAAAPSPERLAVSSEVRERLRKAMDELSGTERAAFIMRHFEGVGIDEIAQALGRPNGATRHSVFRAVEKLRRALEPVMGATS